MKIVWICHFYNEEIQSKLPLWKKFMEYAPWIPNLISGFEKRNDVELHIVAPHIYLKYNTSFVLRGIYYHFLTYGFPIINRPWPSFLALDAIFGYPSISNKINKTVIKINPDIINLQGAENAYYSSSILKLRLEFPCAITIQGFACHMKEKTSQINKRRIIVERKILRSFKFFYLDNDAIQVVKEYSPNMISKVVWWPAAEAIIDTIPETSYSDKIYDILYCGRLEQSKGIEDFITIVGYLKQKNPNIKACVIGNCQSKYYIFLKDLISNLNCSDNITFIGFVETQKQMFSYFKASKLLVVPTLIDRYPSTIREAMRLNLPVMAYRTGSIPWTNNNGENIILIEHGNIFQMATEIEAFLNDIPRQKEIIKSARKFYEAEFSCHRNVDRFISGYFDVINEFKNR